ncbi:MAG: hypothetical protein WC985_09835, partial [Thermoplasmata archaeon]
YIHHTLPHAREQRRQVLEKYLNAFFAGEDEPICCRREGAVDCLLRTHMDAPALGPFLTVKGDRPAVGDQPEAE